MRRSKGRYGGVEKMRELRYSNIKFSKKKNLNKKMQNTKDVE